MEEGETQHQELKDLGARRVELVESDSAGNESVAQEKMATSESGGGEDAFESDDMTSKAVPNEKRNTAANGTATSARREVAAATSFTKVEKSLTSLGFFTPSSRRIKEQKVKRISFTREVDGKHIEVTGEILPSAIFGLPITADQDKYLALQEIITNILETNGEVKNPIKFKSADLLRLLGKDRNAGKNYNEIGEWLDVMSSTMIKSNGLVYNAGQKRFVTDRFHVFDRAVSVGKELEDGTIADANYVWLSQWQIQNINNKFLLPIDFTTYRELKNRIAKALVPLLQIWLFASQKAGSFEKRYDELCEFLTLQRYRSLSQIVRQWKPSLDELQQFGYLAKWQIEKTTDRKAYKIIFFHGAKFHRDRRRRLEQKAQAETPVVIYQSDPVEPELPQPGKLPDADRTSSPDKLGDADGGKMEIELATSSAGDEAVMDTGDRSPNLVDELAARGVVRSVAIKLLEAVPVDRHEHVRDCIEYWDSAEGVGAGFLYELIKAGNPLPATFTPKRVLEARKKEAELSAQRQFIEDLLSRRYEDYRQAVIDRLIGNLSPEEFERRVLARVQELSIEVDQDPAAPWNSPAFIEQTARFTVRVQIGKEASILSAEDFRKQELPAILAELQLQPSNPIGFAA